MANRLGLTLHHSLPILGGVCVHHTLPSSNSLACSIDSNPQLPKALKKKKKKNRASGYRTPRRLVLGIGAAFWAQFMSVAGNTGFKSFTASARQKGAIEQFCPNGGNSGCGPKGETGRIPRRLLLGIGAAFWAEFMSMAGNIGDKSFIASARQKGVIEQVLKNVEWPEQFPFKEEDFQRFDESPDTLFYESPRFVTHIDNPAIAALTRYYSEVFPPSNTPGVAILDMCSSWVSHFPAGYKQDRIVGMGMNEEELKRNPVLTEYVVQDLNINPKLPFEDNSFDIITNVVSVDYLTKPMDVFKELSRILKPGGVAIVSFSNRCFWTKAISIWTSTGDADHAMIVGSYFHYAGGFEPPQAVDISPNPGRSDPMYIVYSAKLAATA